MKAKLLLAAMGAAALVNLYPTAGVVTNIDGDTATVTRCSGFKYTIEAEDLLPGDIIAMIMHDNYTPETIADDKPILTRYVGTPSMFQEVFENAMYEFYFGS